MSAAKPQRTRDLLKQLIAAGAKDQKSAAGKQLKLTNSHVSATAKTATAATPAAPASNPKTAAAFKLVKINDHKVGAIPLEKDRTLKLRGAELLDIDYPNICALGPKGSGKTCTVRYMINARATEETEIFIFCSTAHLDPSYIFIRKEQEGLGRKVTIFTEDVTGNLRNLMADAKREAEASESDDDEPVHTRHQVENGVILVPKKKKKEKPVSPYVQVKRIVVFDDIGDELRSPVMAQWVKTNRHYHSMTIVSTHWISDLLPGTRRQIQLYLVFQRMNEDNLKELLKSAGLPMDIDEFTKLYRTATEQQYSFLYIDVTEKKFRRGFDEALVPK